MKLLFKQSLKSMFKNKVFTSILGLIIIVTGSSYTLFQSTTNSFEKSLNNIVDEGELHDAIIKTKFTPIGTFKLKIEHSDSSIGVKKIIVVDDSATNYDGSDYKLWLDEHYPNGIIEEVQGSNEEEALKKANQRVVEISQQIEKTVVSNESQQFTESIRDIYGEELSARLVQSISVQPTDVNRPVVKIVNYDYSDNVNKMVIFDGTSQFIPQLTNEKFNEEIKSRAQSSFKTLDENDYTINRLKGYRWTAQSKAGTTISLIDPSSYTAIISPSYANANNKKAITINNFNKIYSEQIMDQDVLPVDEWELKYSDNIVWVDHMPFFITGIGTTPDFAYPIIDQKHPTPNTKNEAVVFVNKRGYERVYDGFRTNPKEEYISIKFDNDISASRKIEIKNQIETIARKGSATLNDFKIDYKGNIKSMSWPSNINIVTYFDDRNDQANLSQERIIFLLDIQNTTSTLSIATTTLLIIFVSAVLILVFKALISIDRKKLATLMAFGHSKSKIALNTALSAIIVIIPPTIIGYFIGFSLQYPMIRVFDNFWTIPTYGDTFAILPFILVIVLPVLFVGLLIFVITIDELKWSLPQMLNNKVGRFESVLRIAMKPFKYIGIKTKYAISLMFSNIWRLLLVSIATIITISTVTVGFSSIGVATNAYNSTVAISNYTYQVDLYSPTSEGGQYKYIYDEDIPIITHDPTYAQNSNVDTLNAHWHIPSIGDASFGNLSTISEGLDLQELNKVAHYLENKLQTKVFLNKEVAGINPWDIAKKLMPDNQKNIADENMKDFFDKYKLNESSSINTILDQLAIAIRNDDPMLYTISYNSVIINRDDETYTYLDTTYSKSDVLKNYHVVGFNKETDYLNIPAKIINSLKTFNETNISPIVINKYVATDLSLKEGDTINLSVKNSVNRFIDNDQSSILTEFKVVGIVDTYNDNRMFTLQSFANNTLGLKEDGFNGVFTKKENPSALLNLPLYSPSGIYLATDTITSAWEPILRKIIESNLINNPNIKTVQDFVSKYSRTPFVALIDSVDWKEISKYTFANISALSSSLIYSIQIISILLSVMFTTIISALLINANKRKISTLWSLGYKRSEVIKIISFTYLLPMILGICFGIPIAAGILYSLKIFIMHFGHILIPFALLWWAPIISTIATMLIFIGSILIGVYKLKGHNALLAFKGE